MRLALMLITVLVAACEARDPTPATPAPFPMPDGAPHDPFSAGPFDAPMKEPEPGDWVIEHPQQPQSFEDFAAQRWPSPEGSRRTLYILPIGEFPETVPSLEKLRAFTAAYFQLPVVLLPKEPLIAERYKTRKNRFTDHPQIYTHDIMDDLRGRKPADAYVMIAVTMVDLYPDDDWNFVFGQASPSEGVGVFSLARYWHEDPRASLLRAYKVLAHEIGHDFGMDHCQHHACVMNGANNLDETDEAPLHLCPVCLRKLHSIHRHDVTGRYEHLADLLHMDGLTNDAHWYRMRSAWIRGSEP